MKILFISHLATKTGAPLVLQQVLKALKKSDLDIQCSILFMNDGDLVSEFRTETEKCIVYNKKKDFALRISMRLSGKDKNTACLDRALREFKGDRYDLVYANSIVSLPTAVYLNSFLNAKLLLHVHELSYAVNEMLGNQVFFDLSKKVDTFIAVSKTVKKMLEQSFSIEPAKISLVYSVSKPVDLHVENVQALQNQLHLDESTFVIGGAGQLTWTKGADVFLQIVRDFARQTKNPNFVFLWVGGGINEPYHRQLELDIKKLNIAEHIKFLGVKSNPYDYFGVFSVFLFTSREESFGLVALENATMGKPVVCFDKCGGINEFIDDKTGIQVPYLDTQAAVHTLLQLQRNHALREQLGNAAAEKAKKYFSNEVFNDRIKELFTTLLTKY